MAEVFRRGHVFSRGALARLCIGDSPAPREKSGGKHKKGERTRKKNCQNSLARGYVLFYTAPFEIYKKVSQACMHAAPAPPVRGCAAGRRRGLYNGIRRPFALISRSICAQRFHRAASVRAAPLRPPAPDSPIRFVKLTYFSRVSSAGLSPLRMHLQKN